MELKELTSGDFERELLLLPAKIRKLTSKTAKQKVQNILNKYDDLISHDLEDKYYYRNLYFISNNICEALKTGVVSYKGGVFLVKEISRIETNSETKDVLVYFKNGTMQNFSKDFEWIKKLF